MVASAPAFRVAPPSRSKLDAHVAAYEAITGQSIRTTKQRNFLAAAYRVHGPSLIEVLQATYERVGTTTNLLGIVRSTAPSEPATTTVAPSTPLGLSEPPDVFVNHGGMPCPVERSEPGLVYCRAHRPPFEGSSRVRYDRRGSNADFGHLLDVDTR
jgi:hypothetical protein